jgi:hypothetical protein
VKNKEKREREQRKGFQKNKTKIRREKRYVRVYMHACVCMRVFELVVVEIIEVYKTKKNVCMCQKNEKKRESRSTTTTTTTIIITTAIVTSKEKDVRRE